MNFQSNQNYYEILEISADAPHDEVRRAFLKAKATYSPNSPALYSVFTKEEAEELMRLVDEAYSTLGDRTRRKEYDASLAPVQKKAPSGHNDSTTLNSSPKEDKGSTPPYRAHKRNELQFEVDPAFEDEIKNQSLFDGIFLQKIRLYKNVSLKSLSDQTRISRFYLSAIETHDFDSLPAPVFLRGFVTQYARILRLQEKKVVDSFMKFFRETKG